MDTLVRQDRYMPNLPSAYLFAPAAALPPIGSYPVREEALKSRASVPLDGLLRVHTGKRLG
jgi:hypothetical protein